MRFDFSRAPITDEDDEVIRAALVGIPVVALLSSVAHLTGDYSLVGDDLLPDRERAGVMKDDGYSRGRIEQARDAAAAALSRFRDAGSVAAPAPDAEQLRTLVEFVVGTTVDDDYVVLLEQELGLDGADLRAPDWTVAEIDPNRIFTVAIIGAGMSGLAAAHRLRQAGVEARVYEKNPDVGGTWFENDYPGCRVDIQNHFYSFSFAQSCHWPQLHSSQPVLLDYFQSCVTELQLADAIAYDSEVVEARWDDDEQVWHLRIRGPEGERTESVNAVVSAVGQLNRPHLPEIEGLDSFAGESFHSARWDHDVDVTGKRVAVIGTGASAAQFIPWLAERAEHLTVHQRTPPWLVPVEGYQDDVPENLQWFLRHVPEYARWDRLLIFAQLQEGNLPRTIVDPEWDLSRHSVSASNEQVCTMLGKYREAVFADPELAEKMRPRYPWGGKRMVVDDGSFSGALQRDNVTLDTGRIAAITPSGIRMDDGTESDADVIIYATGFRASDFLMPMRVVGAHGTDLHDRWGGDARAYLGLTVPGFPNLFMMYGPNTNIAITGSVTFFSECQAQFIVESVRMLLEHGARAMDTREAVHDAYNERIDAANELRAWGAADVHTWYRNAKGRIAQNWPFNLLEFWGQTREANSDDYVLS
jgi:4-hydroxyacetophenone monooxygenase